MNSDGFSPGAQEAVPSAPRSTRGLPAWLASLLALLVGVGLTIWVTSLQQTRVQSIRDQQLQNIADSSHDAILTRLRACELLMRSMQTIFLTSKEVEPDEFTHLYLNLKPRQGFPGLLAIGYAQREIGPQGEQFVTKYVEPRAGNEAVAGLNLASQPTNLAAVLTSRDMDEVVMSAPFKLVQDKASDQQGQVMRLPVYSPGAPPSDVGERRIRVVGSLGASFRIGDVIASALSSKALTLLRIQVVDVTGGLHTPLFSSQQAVSSMGSHPFDRELEFGGRLWRVSMQPVETRTTPFDWRLAMLLPGLLASVLLALLVWSEASTRRRALELGRSMSERYRESEERFRAVNELLPALVLLSDPGDSKISYANQASRTRLGELVCAASLPALFEDPLLRERLKRLDTPGCENVEALMRTVNGDQFWASVSIARVELDGRSRLLMVATDISQQRQLTELLSYQASHDALTELSNRREFERQLEHSLTLLAAGGPPFALLYLDLDQFKLINDTSGHIAGDQLLIQLATMMREQLRTGDVLARLGGDEFGILANNVNDLAGAQLVAERLRQYIDGYMFTWEQGSYTITASIGAVMVEEADIKLKELFARADTACYIAKEAGRDRVHFYSAKNDATARRREEMEWANRLRWAIEGQRLQLYYQEVWPLALDIEAGPRLELLLRFRDEDNRIVTPDAFLPAAERYGLMPMIDRWVIDTALAHFDNLHPGGRHLQMATINLSGASIEDEFLGEFILDRLEQYNVDPMRVCFEVTETVAVRNLAQVARFIERLRKVGCRFALDDFGAGMSSFGYLKNLPVDIIKIDGSFIQDLLSDPMSYAIVRAVTDIGHQRNMSVVAEWVDSREIMEALHELHVDYAQGFGLHKPESVSFQR